MDDSNKKQPTIKGPSPQNKKYVEKHPHKHDKIIPDRKFPVLPNLIPLGKTNKDYLFPKPKPKKT